MGDDSTPRPATTRSQTTRSQARGDLLHDSKKHRKNHKNDVEGARRRSPLHDLPEWLVDLNEILVGGKACYLRNVQDLLSDWKTPHERRFGEPCSGPMMYCMQEHLEKRHHGRRH